MDFEKHSDAHNAVYALQSNGKLAQFAKVEILYVTWLDKTSISTQKCLKIRQFNEAAVFFFFLLLFTTALNQNLVNQTLRK